MKYWVIWDHTAFPGPGHWDFKCLECDGAVSAHAPWPLIGLKKLYNWIKK